MRCFGNHVFFWSGQDRTFWQVRRIWARVGGEREVYKKSRPCGWGIRNHAHVGGARPGVLTHLPYLGGMREGISEVTPFWGEYITRGSIGKPKTFEEVYNPRTPCICQISILWNAPKCNYEARIMSSEGHGSRNKYKVVSHIIL